MNRKRAFTVIDNLITGAIIFILALILFPVFARARENARRSSCQSNLKQIEAALWLYVADNNGYSPLGNWDSPLRPYIKEDEVFRCPSKRARLGTSDYFFNARFSKKPLNSIHASQSLILMGDGSGGLLLKQFPSSWLKDEGSPAWRHIEGANYGFADGHIKWLKIGRVTNDFRMVQP